jgi:O-antigen/teichoic acid export membrane protein
VEAGLLSSDVSDPPVDDIDDGHVLDSREAGGRFLRGSSLRLAALAAGLLAGLAATPLAVHYLGPVQWGQYATVAALIFIVAAITEGGLGQMGVRELSVGSAARRAFMAELLGLRISLTLIGVLLALCFTVAVGYAPVVVAGTAIAGVGLLLTNLAGTLALPLVAELRLGWLALLDFLPQLMTAIVMVVLVVSRAPLLPFYAASVLAGGTALLVVVWVVRRQIPLRAVFDYRRWKPLLAQTLVYAAATATGAMYFRIVLLATSVLSTKTQTGYFSLAFRILELTTIVPWLIVSSAFPILVRSAWNDHDRLRYALQRLMEGALILGGWFGLCVVVGAPFAIHVLDLGSRSFDPSIPVLRILGAAIPATFLLATFSYTLLALQLYRQLLIANALIIGLALLLSVALIPEFGAKGGAIASLTLEITLLCSYVSVLARAHPELRPSLAGIERILLSLGLAFVVGVLLLAHPVIGTLAGTATLACLLIALHAIPEELLALLRRRPLSDGS